MKNRQVGAELFQADMTTVPVRYFANATNKNIQVVTSRILSKNASHSMMIFENLRVVGILRVVYQLR
jgi:hypothetical protein